MTVFFGLMTRISFQDFRLAVSGENLLQCIQQTTAFGFAADGDTQAVVDARFVEVAYQDACVF